MMMMVMIIVNQVSKDDGGTRIFLEVREEVRRNAVVYNGLKHEGDVLQKISTQVIQQKNITNIKAATLHNILLKINSKLGGTNQTLHSSNTPHILSRPVMIMGADVTHAAPDQKGIKPSIAAVVASMDPKASQYECEIRIQV